jgi:glutamate synthase domain-containing protein 3
MSVRELNLALKAAADGGRILIENPKGMHHIAAGLGTRCTVEIEGSVGYFAGTMIDGPVIRVRGNAGWFLGDNMTAGEIVVEGHSGNGTGQGLYGGRLVVKGDCGDRIGALMKNGLVAVGGDSGIMTGLYMMGGEIIVLGRLGESAGESMVGGKIFFSGPEPTLGKNAKIEETTDEETEHVERILRDYGLAAPKMRKIVPENQGTSADPRGASGTSGGRGTGTGWRLTTVCARYAAFAHVFARSRYSRRSSRVTWPP